MSSYSLPPFSFVRLTTEAKSTVINPAQIESSKTAAYGASNRKKIIERTTLTIPRAIPAFKRSLRVTAYRTAATNDVNKKM